MSVENTLDRLSYLLRSAPGVPLSASALVNRAELLALVEQALSELPAEVEEAIGLLQRREQFLESAQRDADRIVADARRRADELVENSAVVFRARSRANEIVSEAEEAARTARRDADDWCDRRLGVLEAEVERALGQLRRGRLVLEQRLKEDGGAAGRAGQSGPSGRTGGTVTDVSQALDGELDPGSQMVIDLREGRRPGRYPARRPGQAKRGGAGGDRGDGGAELGTPSDLQ